MKLILQQKFTIIVKARPKLRNNAIIKIEVLTMGKQKTTEQQTYQVPEEIKQRVRAFMNEFLKEHEISKSGLVRKMNAELGRSASKTAMMDKFSRVSFKLTEVMEILDLYGYELKIVPKRAIEHAEPSTTTKF